MGKVSNCCSARPASYLGVSTEDLQLCPRCLEHCSYEDDPKEKIEQLLKEITEKNNELLIMAATLNEQNKAAYSKRIAAIINETILIMKKTPQANGA